MPEAKGKENVIPASPKKGGIDNTNGTPGEVSPQSTAYPASPATNGSSKSGKRISKGKMALARVHMLDGTECDFSIEVSAPILWLINEFLSRYVLA
jgi:hypothetical protein